MQEIKISGVSVSPSQRYILPTDEEIGFMSETKRQFVDGIPLAVRIKRVKGMELRFLTEKYVAVEKQHNTNICRSYSQFAFLQMFQFKLGTHLLPGHFKAMELIQTIPETKTMTYYPPANASDFSNGLDHFESTYADEKQIMPLLDPAHTETELKKMVLDIVDRKYKFCAVIGRNFNLDGWDIIMPELKKNKIMVLVLCTYPRATRTDSGKAYSTLCPPILMGANVVSHGMAWSGGPSPPKRLGRDLIYHAGKGVASKYEYHDNRAEAVNVMSSSLRNDIKNYPNPRLLATIEGFSHFSEFA